MCADSKVNWPECKYHSMPPSSPDSWIRFILIGVTDVETEQEILTLNLSCILPGTTRSGLRHLGVKYC